MRAHFRLSDLIPAELNEEAMHHSADVIVVAAHGQSRDCRCPERGKISHRVHSRYPRMIADLPCAGRNIEPHLTVRRFVCSANQCRRKIFAERFGSDIVRPMARRQPVWTAWSGISLSRWVVDRRRVLPIVSGFRLAMTRCFEPFGDMIAHRHRRRA